MPPVEEQSNKLRERTLDWVIETAFDNYENAVNKYEKLLVDNIVQATSIKQTLSDLDDRLENLPDKQILVAADERIRTISGKLSRLFWIFAIVGGIGITTYIWINAQVDHKIKTIVSQSIKEIGQPNQINKPGKLYIVDHDGNKIPIVIDNQKQ